MSELAEPLDVEKHAVKNVSQDDIIRMYKTPGHPIAFSSPQFIYKYFEGRIPLTFITESLEHADTYTLHREYKKPKTYNPFYCYERRVRFQADLIDISSLHTSNRGTRYLLLVIDEFSRKIWVLPLTRKSGKITADAFEDWIRHMELDESGWEEKQKKVLHDNGTEFFNVHVRELFQRKNIEQIGTRNVIHCGIAERANKSLQSLIYKYLTDKGETKYIDSLPALVHTYNSRGHRTLNYMSPNDADLKNNADAVRKIHSARFAKLLKKKSARREKFSVGDRVRVKSLARGVSSARRSYLEQFQREMFTVSSVNKRMPIPMYNLTSMDRQDTILGGFYANELSRVRGDLFKIDKILKTVGKGRNKKHLVRWKGFGEQWDSYVFDRDIVKNAI